jgi:hypothetical protein
LDISVSIFVSKLQFLLLYHFLHTKFISKNFSSQVLAKMNLKKYNYEVICEPIAPRNSDHFSTPKEIVNVTKEIMKKQKLKKKCISFHDKKEVRTIKSDSYSDIDRNKLWYSREEIINLKRNCVRYLLVEMNPSNDCCPEDDEDDELRGMEHLQSLQTYKETRRKRKTILKEVLRVQQLQKLLGTPVEETLRSTYYMQTQQEKRKAIDLGKSDALLAFKIYEEDHLLAKNTSFTTFLGTNDPISSLSEKKNGLSCQRRLSQSNVKMILSEGSTMNSAIPLLY